MLYRKLYPIGCIYSKVLVLIIFILAKFSRKVGGGDINKGKAVRTVYQKAKLLGHEITLVDAVIGFQGLRASLNRCDKKEDNPQKAV